MAVLTDLPNELVLNVRSHLQQPADIRALTLANRRFYRMVIPLLYERIALDLEDCTLPDFEEKRHDHYAYPTIEEVVHPTLTGLTQTLVSQEWIPMQSLQPGAAIKDLSIRLDPIYGEAYPSLFSLLPHLTGLVHLRMMILKPQRGFNVFRASNIVKGLEAARETLQSLVLCVEEDYGNPGRIGSLTRFTAMKHLCIQAHVLLGCRQTPQTSRFSKFDRFSPKVSKLLPESLETLQLHCGINGRDFGDDGMEQMSRMGLAVCCPLEGIRGVHPAVRARVLKSVVVCRRQKSKNLRVRIGDLKMVLDVVGTFTSHPDFKLEKKTTLRSKDEWAFASII